MIYLIYAQVFTQTSLSRALAPLLGDHLSETIGTLGVFMLQLGLLGASVLLECVGIIQD